jgi:hypothetical protein
LRNISHQVVTNDEAHWWAFVHSIGQYRPRAAACPFSTHTGGGTRRDEWPPASATAITPFVFAAPSWLADMNGLELVQQMRARGIRAPVIMSSSPFLRRDASAAGIPIVEKPLLENTLTDQIRSILGSTA